MAEANIAASASLQLRNHLATKEYKIMLFIELMPNSRDAECSLPLCTQIIKPGTYRLALAPGMNHPTSSSRHADLYHVRCFEELADLSQADVLGRLEPLTRNTHFQRILQATDAVDKHHFCEGGVERLVLEWKIQRNRWINKLNGMVKSPEDENEEDFLNLLYNAGSSTGLVKRLPSSPLPGMSQHEFLHLSRCLAPVESDGPQDTEEWKLFRTYLPAEDDNDSLHDRHSLSKMLLDWEKDSHVATIEEADLDEAGRQRKALLSDKAIRAIKRLTAVPMPEPSSL